MSTVYVPDRNVAIPAAREHVIHDFEAKAPDALMLVYGDFNHCSLHKTSLQYHQHATLPAPSTKSQAKADYVAPVK